jgi:hypothetical protein
VRQTRTRQYCEAAGERKNPTEIFYKYIQTKKEHETELIKKDLLKCSYYRKIEQLFH